MTPCQPSFHPLTCFGWLSFSAALDTCFHKTMSENLNPMLEAIHSKVHQIEPAESVWRVCHESCHCNEDELDRMSSVWPSKAHKRVACTWKSDFPAEGCRRSQSKRPRRATIDTEVYDLVHICLLLCEHQPKKRDKLSKKGQKVFEQYLDVVPAKGVAGEVESRVALEGDSGLVVKEVVVEGVEEVGESNRLKNPHFSPLKRLS